MNHPDRRGAAIFPGGRQIVALVGALIVVLALLVWRPGSSDEVPGQELLAGLGDADNSLDALKGSLGGASGPGMDEPLDLDAGGGYDPGEPDGIDLPGDPVGLDLPGDGGDLPDLPPRVDGRAAPAADPPAARAAASGGAAGDARLLEAHAAGDSARLIAAARDGARAIDDRVLALTLASDHPDAAVSEALHELFESADEDFAIRESALYALLERDPAGFPDYLVRVMARPRVKSGEDEETARLLKAGFYGDRWVHGGAALDRVADRVMAMARAGSPTALAVLSFALAPERPLAADRELLEAGADEPLVSENLARFYRAMISRGRTEFAEPLARLGGGAG